MFIKLFKYFILINYMLFVRLARSLDGVNKAIDFYNLQNYLRIFMNPLAKEQLNREICDNIHILNNSVNEFGYSKNLLSLSPLIHSYIIVWNKNAETNIHSHSKNGCFSYIIKGSLLEEIYKNNLYVESRYMFSNNSHNNLHKNLEFIDENIGQHKIINLDNDMSYSINIYSPSPSLNLNDLGVTHRALEFYNKLNNLQN